MSKPVTKVIEVIEREIEGVFERASFAQRLLQEVSQEAYTESDETVPTVPTVPDATPDAKEKLAELTRKLSNELKKFLSTNEHELRYGRKNPF